MSRPDLLIEQWLPTKELGIESRRENSTGQHPPLNRLHVWWARRPLTASAGAVLGSLLPAWSPALAAAFPDDREVADAASYRTWFLRLCGILGDPVKADALTQAARASGKRIPNPFTYKQAYKNQPASEALDLLHRLLERTWRRTPIMIDPTAGGGSIPFEAIRYGIPSIANELNPVASAVLRAGVELPARFGESLTEDVRKFGERLTQRIKDRLEPFFPSGSDGQVATFLFARTVACPRTGKVVPLAPNWWLSKDKGGTAVRLVIERDGVELDEPEFDIVKGKEIDKRATDNGTISRGTAVSPWDQLVVDGDYIKAEAKAGRMGSILYAVAVRGPKGRKFRPPTQTDRDALRRAEQELSRLLPDWDASDVLPDESIPEGNKTSEPMRYGIRTWRDMFSPRQLLAHGTFVEEFRRLVPEVRAEIADSDRADAVLALLAIMQNKALNYNARLSAWHPTRGSLANVFDRHDFAFKWTHGEFESARELYPWALSQVLNAYGGLATLLHPGEMGQLSDRRGVGSLGEVRVTRGNAGNLSALEDRSLDLVCIDPPYYDNVMYAELADFFYVWERRTLGLVWPELFESELTDKDQEAVANPSRFVHAGKRKKELATLDYERKMTAIFEECRRVLVDAGVMTVMFTHKKAEAWDTLGQSLLEAGFTVEASWPVPTESAHSLHQARKNSAASTIFLVCRKRPMRDHDDRTFFDSIEGEVRAAARDAYTRFTDLGLDGVDRLLATYGPALSVLSDHWPVYSSAPDADGRSRLLRPDEALQVAQEEVVRLQRSRLVSTEIEYDAITDWWLVAWDMFGAREFPFDEARKLAFAVGGVDIDDLVRGKVLAKKSGSVELVPPRTRVRRDAESELPGVNRDRASFPVALDALHTALYVVDLDGISAARAWLEQRQLTSDPRFESLVAAAVRAVPRTRDKGELTLVEADLLERLARAVFEDIEIPEPEATLEEGQQSLGI